MENPVSFVKMILLAFWSFIQIFILCELSERVNSQFSEVDIYQSNWYEYPIHARRSIPTAIMNMNTSVVFKGFGNIECSRETFQRVI